MDELWPLIGYKRKENAQNNLRLFKEGIDYVSLLKFQKQKQQGGLNKVKIMLTGECAQALAVMSRSEAGIAFNSAVHAIMRQFWLMQGKQLLDAKVENERRDLRIRFAKSELNIASLLLRAWAVLGRSFQSEVYYGAGGKDAYADAIYKCIFMWASQEKKTCWPSQD